MRNSVLIMCIAAAVIVPVAIAGCKGKVETSPEEMDVISTTEGPIIVEPSDTVASEAIPPSAAPEIAQPRPKPILAAGVDRNMEIQRALKKAGYYMGAIDGKIGPKSKKAIEDFQRDKGLIVDGKVGPKTWAELEKYLVE